MKKTLLESFAENELRLAGFYDEDSDYGGMIPEAVLNVIKAFSKDEHSGGSASIVISLLPKLLRYEPLTPLTGEDSEWNTPSHGMIQNNRCFHVFKDENGQAYDSEGKIFREKNGATYTSKGSRVNITFPYTPKREYVDVDETTP
jgi:hypothetical protein